MRDLNRTYPSHVYYQQRQGPGQLSLYNVLKAFSLYDSKVLLRLSLRVHIKATRIRACSLHDWVASPRACCPGAIAKLPRTDFQFWSCPTPARPCRACRGRNR